MKKKGIDILHIRNRIRSNVCNLCIEFRLQVPVNGSKKHKEKACLRHVEYGVDNGSKK